MPRNRPARPSLVAVAVVDVRIVEVAVAKRGVSVPVGVLFARRRRLVVLMAVVLVVVRMPMFMLRRLVDVLMLVTLGRVQPHTDGHERARENRPDPPGNP